MGSSPGGEDPCSTRSCFRSKERAVWSSEVPPNPRQVSHAPTMERTQLALSPENGAETPGERGRGGVGGHLQHTCRGRSSIACMTWRGGEESAGQML